MPAEHVDVTVFRVQFQATAHTVLTTASAGSSVIQDGGSQGLRILPAFSAGAWITCAALISALLPGRISQAQDAPFAAARPGAWRVIGPGGGGAQFNPTISPRDPRLIFVSSDMTGSYVSEDGG